METFLQYTILGLVTGAVYGIAASGLVVTYTTSGIFNFAHGAIAMLAAFVYWQVRFDWGWPAPVAIVVVLGVLAPLLGTLLYVGLMRGLRGTSEVTRIVVPVSVMLGFLALATWIWDPTPSSPRLFLLFFGADNTVSIAGVNVTYHELLAVVLAVVIALALRFLFFRTRNGVAMRAVVDDPDLLELNAGRPERLAAMSWALGAFLAALAGVLITPIQGSAMSATALTLLVIDAFAAAMFGRLRSLPRTFVGALVLGLAGSYVIGYFPAERWTWTGNFRVSLPMIALFVVLLFLPQDRLRDQPGRPLVRRDRGDHRSPLRHLGQRRRRPHHAARLRARRGGVRGGGSAGGAAVAQAARALPGAVDDGVRRVRVQHGPARDHRAGAAAAPHRVQHLPERQPHCAPAQARADRPGGDAHVPHVRDRVVRGDRRGAGGAAAQQLRPPAHGHERQPRGLGHARAEPRVAQAVGVHAVGCDRGRGRRPHDLAARVRQPRPLRHLPQPVAAPAHRRRRRRLRERRPVRRHPLRHRLRGAAEHLRQVGRRSPRLRRAVRVPGPVHHGAAGAHGRQHRPQPHRGRRAHGGRLRRPAPGQTGVGRRTEHRGRGLPAGPQREHQQLVVRRDHRAHDRGHARGGAGGTGGAVPDVPASALPLELVGVSRPYELADRDMLDRELGLPLSAGKG